MLSLIIVQSAEARDSFVSALSLEKHFESGDAYPSYKHGKWILIYDMAGNLPASVEWAIENYMPEKIYLPFFGRVVDTVREIGDIILPNVLLSYNPQIETVELNEKNRDSFISGARFLEIYDEQKDYYVEDFGLSIGGIAVDRVPTGVTGEKLMLAYEGDIYLSGGLDEAYQIVTTLEFPVVIATGVIDGKKPKNITLSPLDHTVRNMVTTFRLLEGE